MAARARLLALASVVAVSLVSSRAVRAAWLEGGDGSGATPVPTATLWYPTYPPTPVPTRIWLPPPPPPYGDAGARAIHDFLQSAYLGASYGWGGLTIVPIVTRSGAGADVESLDAAVRSGDLRVLEKGSGSVPSVMVENVGRTPVLLMAGEIVLGGRQDRIIRQDVVIGPRSGPVEVPVYCVEEGRWEVSRREEFEPAPYAIADGALREKAASGAGQEEIWHDVNAKAAAPGVHSTTQAYRDWAQSPDVARRLDGFVSHCPHPSFWRGHAVGAIFLGPGGQVLGADVFGDSSLLYAEWPKLVRSYAAQVGEYDGPDASGWSAQNFFSQLQASWPSFDGWAGHGARHRLPMSGFDAWGVTLDARMVHVAALATAPVIIEEPPPPPPPPYEPRDPLYPRPDE